MTIEGHGGAMRLEVSTASLPTRERFEFWQEVISQQAVPIAVRTRHAARFVGSVKASDFGAVKLVVTDNRLVDVERTHRLIGLRDPEAYLLVLNLRGHQRFEQDSHTAVIGPGEMVLVHSSHPFRSTSDPRYVQQLGAVVVLPPGTLPVTEQQLRQLVAVPLSYTNGIVSLVSRYLYALGTGSFCAVDVGRLSAVTSTLISTMLARRLDVERQVPPEIRAEALFASIQAYALDRLGDVTLTPETIASSHRISLRTLQRIFYANGVSVASWIRTQRLEVPPSAAPGADVLVDVGGEEEPAAPIVGPIPAKLFIGRSPGQLAWLRLKRDKTATSSGFVVLFFVVVALLAPVIEWIYGYSPYTFNARLLDNGGLPLGYLGGVTFSSDNASNHIHILGVTPQVGQDIFITLVYGARTSLGIAFSASIIALALGIMFGVIAAYFGGWVDAVISWFIDFMLAFPFLLFAIAVIPVVNTLIADETGGVSAMKRILTIIIVFSAFGWMGTARLVRGQVVSLREREYVEAARAAGAGGIHIMFRQILPNLWAAVLVSFSLAMPATVTAEAALSFLNIGVLFPTPDWGRMVNESIPWMRADPVYTFVPGFLILVLVLAFNLFGDALRDALVPKSVR